MKFDVRNEITEIVFSEYIPYSTMNAHLACLIDKNSDGDIFINDQDCNNFVAINSKEHALNLIKALNKAIDLGWVK